MLGRTFKQHTLAGCILGTHKPDIILLIGFKSRYAEGRQGARLALTITAAVDCVF